MNKQLQVAQILRSLKSIEKTREQTNNDEQAEQALAELGKKLLASIPDNEIEQQAQKELANQILQSREKVKNEPYSEERQYSPSNLGSGFVGPKEWNNWGEKRKQTYANKTVNPDLLYKKFPNHVFFLEGYLPVPGEGFQSSSVLPLPPATDSLVGEFYHHQKEEALLRAETNELNFRKSLHKKSFAQLEQLKELAQLKPEDIRECLTAQDLRAILRKQNLSDAYITENFPDLDRVFESAFDYEEIKYREMVLKMKKEYAKNPKKLFKRLPEELVVRLKAGENMESIVNELKQLKLSKVKAGKATKKIQKELIDAGFSEDDIINYKDTVKKISSDPVVRAKANKFIKNTKSKRLQKMGWGNRIINTAFLLSATPISLSMDISVGLVKSLFSPSKPVKIKYNSFGRDLKLMRNILFKGTL